MSAPVRPLGDLLRTLIAPAVWFSHFALLYAAETLICIGSPVDRGATMRWTVLLATAAALAGLFILAVRQFRAKKENASRSDRGSSWLRSVSLLLILLSALGIIWTALPATVLPACALEAGLP